MQKIILLLTLVCAIVFQTRASSDIVITTLESGGPNGNASMFNKIEFGLDLPDEIEEQVSAFLASGEGLNPYDPEAVDVTAVFTGPNGKSYKAFGFHMVDYMRNAKKDDWVKKPQEFGWRIRFAPDQVGTWKMAVTVTTNKTKVYPQRETTFECVKSKNPGFVVRGNKSDQTDRYLRYSGSNETFMVIGENMVWADFELTPKAYDRYSRWFQELGDNGGNFVRVGMISWEYAIEWEELGSYQSRQNRAWELDELFRQAEQNGIYINLLLNLHASFDDKPWEGHVYNWDYHPYRTGIASVEKPIDFFKDAEARKYFRNRLRYLHARWGYSTSLAVWELYSEIDKGIKGYNSSESDRLIVQDWFREMDLYLKNELGDRYHLTGGSYSIKELDDYEQKVAPVTDITFNHDYGRDEDQNYNKRWKRTQFFLSHANTFNHPTLHQEIGANIYAGLDACSDITFHNGIWSTALSGNCGTGLNWWWDFAIHEKGYFTNFYALNVFMQDVKLAQEPYNAKRCRNRKVENFALVNVSKQDALGWVHNRSYWWPNLYQEKECIREFIDKNSGTHIDPADNTTYADWRDDDKTTDYDQVKFKVKGLQRGSIFKRQPYKVTWYRTRGKGGVYKPEANTEQIIGHAKCNFWGTVKVRSPRLAGDEADWGYKLQIVNP